MDNYTMTFKYDGYFDLPDDPEIREREVPGMVLEKLQNGDFELVDFNLSENYNEENAENYIDSHLHRSIVEMRLDLKIKELKSREAIFERCLKALEQNELCLARAFENQNDRLGMLQSIIIFDMKDRCAVSA